MKNMKRFIQQKAAFTLAEVFLPHSKGQRKIAFTLAEVLITLGIIGVVAAITMPTLIKNYNKIVLVNQLKKSVSMLEQGFQKIIADNGVEHLTDISGFDSDCRISTFETDLNCKQNLIPLLKSVFKCDILSQNRTVVASLSQKSEDVYIGSISFVDGMEIFVFYSYADYTHGRENFVSDIVSRSGGKLYQLVARLFIDVNGSQSGPNTDGRDIFRFVLGNDGKLFAEGGKDYAIFTTASMRSSGNDAIVSDNELNYTLSYWRTSTWMCGAPGGSVSGSAGSYCAPRIIENGWKMDY